MNKAAFPARLKTIALVLILVVLLAGCANTRQGVSWPKLDTVEINGTTAVVIVYEKQIEMINPGLQVRLVETSDNQGSSRLWQIDGSNYEDAQFFTAPLVVEEDGDTTLMFPTYNNRILEFDLQTVESTSTTGIALERGVIAKPLMTDAMLYVPYRNEDLAAFDRETYSLQWRLDTAGGVWASPVLVDETLYVASMDHNLYALNAETGDILWTVDLQGAAAAAPLYHDGYLYIGSYSHKLFKIDTSGQVVAEYEGEGWIWSTPVIVDDVVYYTDLSGTVYTLNSNDLSEILKNTVADGGSRRGIRPAPLVTEDYVIVASRNGSIYWLDRSTLQVINSREIEGKPELLSDLLLLEAGTVEGVAVPLVAVATLDKDKPVVFFQLDNFTQYSVYER